MIWCADGLGLSAALIAVGVAEIAKTEISAAYFVPDAKIKAIISSVSAVMLLMVGGCYQPAPCWTMNKPAREDFPAHMIADAHHRHDGEDEAEHGDVDGDEKHQGGDDERAGEGLCPMEAHGRPCGGRAAVMMDGVEDFEDFGCVHPAVGPIKPCVVDGEIGQQAEREIPERHGVEVGIYLRPAMMLPAPCDDPCGRGVDEGAGEAP